MTHLYRYKIVFRRQMCLNIVRFWNIAPWMLWIPGFFHFSKLRSLASGDLKHDFPVIFEVTGGQWPSNLKSEKTGEPNIAKELYLNFYQNLTIFRHICPRNTISYLHKCITNNPPPFTLALWLQKSLCEITAKNTNSKPVSEFKTTAYIHVLSKWN